MVWSIDILCPIQGTGIWRDNTEVLLLCHREYNGLSKTNELIEKYFTFKKFPSLGQKKWNTEVVGNPMRDSRVFVYDLFTSSFDIFFSFIVLRVLSKVVLVYIYFKARTRERWSTGYWFCGPTTTKIIVICNWLSVPSLDL